MQEILSGEKLFYTNDKITPYQMKKSWSELAVKNIQPLIESNKKLQMYLPMDEMRLGRLPDREFVWKIIATTLPEYAKEFMSKVLE